MKVINDNQENILEEVVTSKFQTLVSLLEIINKNEKINQNTLRKESKFSMGKIYPSVKAIRTMRLAENGDGLKITELGKKFLFTYKSDKKSFTEILKNSCLNVPLFRKIFQENKDEINPKNLFDIFKRNLEIKYTNIDNKFIGAVVRRYLEGIYNINLRSGAGTYERKKENNVPKNKKNTEDKINSIKNFKRSFNLSGANLMNMVDTLPKEKRDEIISHVFSEV